MIAYAITDPSTLSFESSEILTHCISSIAGQADMILYRDKNNPDYASNAELFLKLARRHGFSRILLHMDIDLAYRLRADGIHLTSRQIEDISYARKKEIFTVVSTHSLQEALQAEKRGADMVTFSPVFSSPGKGEPVGIAALREVVSACAIPVVALGGVVGRGQIEACKEAGAAGYASIRYFARELRERSG